MPAIGASVVPKPIAFQKATSSGTKPPSASVQNGKAAAQSASAGGAPQEEKSGEELTLPSLKKHISRTDAAEIISWADIRGPCRTLNNLGNTCFMNSTLQCLATIPAFVQYLQSGSHSSSCDAAQKQQACVFCIVENFIGTIIYNAEKARSAATPNSLSNGIRLLGKQFRVGRQEDSHEFLRCLLQKMHRETLSLAGVKEGSSDRRDETDAMHKIFGGYFRNQVHCTRCGFDSNSYESFMDLCLEVGNGITSVDKALRHFVSKEILDENNKWKCPRCKTPVRAQKQLTIRLPPPVLTIQLKRFSFTPMVKGGAGKKGFNPRMMMMALMGAGRKLTDHIAFEEQLDLTPALSDAALKELGATPGPGAAAAGPGPRAVYDLHGVLVHHGSTPHSGHYFAFTKAANGQWHCMNDSSITGANWSMVSKQQAYMLFYSRRPSTVPASGLLPDSVLAGHRKASVSDGAEASGASGAVATAAAGSSAATEAKVKEKKAKAAAEATAASAAPSLPTGTAATAAAATASTVAGPTPTSIDDFDALTWTPGLRGGATAAPAGLSFAAAPKASTGSSSAAGAVAIPAIDAPARPLSDDRYLMTKKGRLDELMPEVKALVEHDSSATGAAERPGKRARLASASSAVSGVSAASGASGDDLTENFAREPVSPAKAAAAATASATEEDDAMDEDEDGHDLDGAGSDGDEDEDSDGAPEEESARHAVSTAAQVAGKMDKQAKAAAAAGAAASGGAVSAASAAASTEGEAGNGYKGAEPLGPLERLKLLSRVEGWRWWITPDITSSSCVPGFVPSTTYLGLDAGALRFMLHRSGVTGSGATGGAGGLSARAGGKQRHVKFDLEEDELDEAAVALEMRRQAEEAMAGSKGSSGGAMASLAQGKAGQGSVTFGLVQAALKSKAKVAKSSADDAMDEDEAEPGRPRLADKSAPTHGPSPLELQAAALRAARQGAIGAQGKPSAAPAGPPKAKQAQGGLPSMPVGLGLALASSAARPSAALAAFEADAAAGKAGRKRARPGDDEDDDGPVIADPWKSKSKPKGQDKAKAAPAPPKAGSKPGSTVEQPEFAGRAAAFQKFAQQALGQRQDMDEDADSSGSDSDDSSSAGGSGQAAAKGTGAQAKQTAFGGAMAAALGKAASGAAKVPAKPADEDSDSDSDSSGGLGSAPMRPDAVPGAAGKARRGQLEQVQITGKLKGRSFDPSLLSGPAGVVLTTASASAPAATAAPQAPSSGFGLGGWGDDSDDDDGAKPSAKATPAQQQGAGSHNAQHGWPQDGQRSYERPSYGRYGDRDRFAVTGPQDEESWNQALDTGRLKKIKDPSKGAGAATDLRDGLQAVLDARQARQSLLPGGKGYRRGHDM